MLTAAPLQTSYNQYAPVAQVGLVGDMNLANIDTRICDDPSGDGVGFGLAVSQGTLHGDKSAAIGQISGGAFVGITIADQTLIASTTALVDKYVDTDNMGVLTFGTIWVSPATDVVVGTQAYFNDETGELGGSSIPNAVAIVGSRWVDSKPNTDQPTLNFNGLARVNLGIKA